MFKIFTYCIFSHSYLTYFCDRKRSKTIKKFAFIQHDEFCSKNTGIDQVQSQVDTWWVPFSGNTCFFKFKKQYFSRLEGWQELVKHDFLNISQSILQLILISYIESSHQYQFIYICAHILVLLSALYSEYLYYAITQAMQVWF